MGRGVHTEATDGGGAAIEAILAERGKTHGDPALNFDVTADVWNGYIRGLRAKGQELLSGIDVAVMMVLFKAARVSAGSTVFHDHYVDMIGYAKLAAKLNEGPSLNKILRCPECANLLNANSLPSCPHCGADLR